LNSEVCTFRFFASLIAANPLMTKYSLNLCLENGVHYRTPLLFPIPICRNMKRKTLRRFS